MRKGCGEGREKALLSHSCYEGAIFNSRSPASNKQLRYFTLSQCLVQTLFNICLIYLVCFYVNSLLQVVKIVKTEIITTTYIFMYPYIHQCSVAFFCYTIIANKTWRYTLILNSTAHYIGVTTNIMSHICVCFFSLTMQNSSSWDVQKFTV